MRQQCLHRLVVLTDRGNEQRPYATAQIVIFEAAPAGAIGSLAGELVIDVDAHVEQSVNHLHGRDCAGAGLGIGLAFRHREPATAAKSGCAERIHVHRHIDGRAATHVPGVGVGAFVEQEHRDVKALVVQRIDQRRDAVRVGFVDVGARLHQ